MKRTAFVALLAATVSAPAFGGALVDHRALYTMTLARSAPGSDIQGLSGQMMLEVKSTCGGSTVTQRLKTETWGDDADDAQTGELTASSFETADGKSFRFTMHNEVNGEVVEDFQGAAARKAPAVAGKVTYVGKKFAPIGLPAGVVFPGAYMDALVAAAQAEKHVLAVTVFDGSDPGKVYHSTSIIGPESEADRTNAAPLKGMRHWPIDLSYFLIDSDDPTPDYETSFDLYENGVSANLVMDYGDFAMRGELASLEILPAPKCGPKN